MNQTPDPNASPQGQAEAAAQAEELCACGDPECPGSVTYPHPFKVNANYVGPDASDLIGHFSVRTTSWEWDGERTDLHDMLGLLWAMNMRARDVASVHLLDEHFEYNSDSEIYARVLFPSQEGSLTAHKGRAYLKALSTEAYSAQDLVMDVFGVHASGPEAHEDAGASYQNPPDWVMAIRRKLRLPERNGWEFNHRDAFDWHVFTSLKRGISVAKFGLGHTDRLRQVFSGFRPRVADVGGAVVYRTDHLVNAVPQVGLQRAKALLQVVEETRSDPMVIPMDSHFVLLGRTALVAAAVESGARVFEEARVTAEERREKEAAVFMLDARVCWSERPSPERFEELIGELLAREPGVHWVRQVGATREPDDGRDFLADWSAPPVGLSTSGVADGLVPPNERQRVIVQVKLRTKGVGRADLSGLRDMIEHHQATGLLVVGFPNLTVQLIDHLDRLRRGGRYWVDWWGRSEIDRRLRIHPELVSRYADVVTLAPASSSGHR